MLESTYLPSLLKASWQGGLLILLVLALQWLLRRRLSPHWRYGLWLLVALRLALPWTVPSPVSVFNLLNLFRAPVGATGAARLPEAPVLLPATSASAAQPSAVVTATGSTAAFHWLPNLKWLGWVWLVGTSGLTIYLAVTHYRFSRRIVGRRLLVDERVLNLLEDCKQQMGVRAPIVLVETPHIGSPALFGFVRPRLLLPAGLIQNFSLQELRYVFLHELGHIKRHDILMGWLMTAVQIVHWFNPLVWLAFHRMRVDRELACDALVLAHTREDENQSYGSTIIKLLENFGRSAWAPSLAGTVENQTQLQERIAMIATFKKNNRGLALAVTLFAGLGFATLTDAEITPAQPTNELLGTWVLVGAPGSVGEAPVVGGRLKAVTEGHWSLTQADPVSGTTVFHHGGTWTLKDGVYAETVDYANESTSPMIHHTFKFKMKLDGDILTLTGIGNPWKEVWKRVKSDTVQPLKPEAIPQGKWHGKEAGREGDSEATLTLNGANLEFHGMDTNEWYKGTFKVYDTNPKQIVATVTECPLHQYVGQTSYAIYQIQDGILTLTGNEPGNPTVPAGFDAPGSRKLTFKQE